MKDYTVDCDRCEWSESTNSYERAKDLAEQHHIPTGHRPPIKEN